MHSESPAQPLQGAPLLINLGAQAALECTDGAIWASFVADREQLEQFESIDELLYPGGVLISCEPETYCVSSLTKTPSAYKVHSSERTCEKDLRSTPRLSWPGYTLHKTSIGCPEEVLL